MKYLHSTPIRQHGFLTSRNCVIDARWVLKVTDYGLPAFYEAQGIQPPLKSAKGNYFENVTIYPFFVSMPTSKKAPSWKNFNLFITICGYIV